MIQQHRTSHESVETLFACFLFCALASILLMPEFAYASDTQNNICNIVTILKSQTGRNIASVGIILVGIGALMGKVSAPLAMTVIFGIAFTFSSTDLVKVLTGKTLTCMAGAAMPQSRLEIIMCNVTKTVLGRTGSAFAILAVIMAGVGAMMGKISWGIGLSIVVGIACIFGFLSILSIMIGPVGMCS
jgi:type IV secretory pathway VirB2 component (pilin)